MLQQPDQFGRLSGGDRLDALVHRRERGLVIDRRIADAPLGRRQALRQRKGCLRLPSAHDHFQFSNSTPAILSACPREGPDTMKIASPLLVMQRIAAV